MEDEGVGEVDSMDWGSQTLEWSTMKINPINKDNNTENSPVLCSHVSLSIVPVKSGAQVQPHTIPWGFLRVFI